MRIKDFARFQHFKDRTPPWIKLYRDILDDIEWHELDPVAAKVLVSLWLIASEDKTMQGILPPVKTLAFRLRMSVKDVETAISKLSHWLEQGDTKSSQSSGRDDINLISGGYQTDNTQEVLTRSQETETETETEKENPNAPAKPSRFDPLSISLPASIEAGTWAEWISYRRIRRLPCAKPTIDAQVRNLSDWAAAGHNPNEIIMTSIANGWQGLFEPKGAAPKSAYVPAGKRKARMNHLGFVEEYSEIGGIKGWSATDFHSIEDYEAARCAA